jgi:uncharacterized protein (TIGR03084 family)
MDAIVAALGEQQAELSGLLTGLDERDWQRPSPCEGWSIADVVLHVAQTNELAVASATGRFAEEVNELTRGVGPASSVDDGADRMVARERGQTGRAVGERWETSAQDLRQVLGKCDPHQRVVWVAGELSARTLATTRLAETWIHSGDVAAGLGVVLAPADRLWHIARLAWRTLPYAFSRAGRRLAGPVAFELDGPAGDRWNFLPDSEPLTHIRGDAVELCLVAARRLDPADTALAGEGIDAGAVLELIRTYA